MLPDGRYKVSVPQIAELIGTSKNTMSRDLKRLLGESFRPSKISIEKINQKINVVSLTELMMILNKIAFAGNVQAQSLLLALAEESIERRFNNAFNIKCSEDEYNERLKIRIERIEARIVYTDVLMKRHLELYGAKPIADDYKKWTVKVNKFLYNRPHFKCDRDNMTIEEQRIIIDFERTANRFAVKYPEATPIELIDRTLETF
jgi:IS30 family transposase